MYKCMFFSTSVKYRVEKVVSSFDPGLGFFPDEYVKEWEEIELLVSIRQERDWKDVPLSFKLPGNENKMRLRNWRWGGGVKGLSAFDTI